MNEWIDLTVLIDEFYKEYPSDIPFKVSQEKEYSRDSFNMIRIATNMHIGTHMDAPKHVLDKSEGIETVDINKMIGKAIVLEPKISKGIINTEDLVKQYQSGFRIAIIKTNHSRYFNTDEYYNYPSFSHDALDFFIVNQIEVLALDMPSPKYINETFLDMHKDLLSRDILIVENLTNLDMLSKHVEFIGLPLKIKGFDGSLVRCVAKNINTI